MSSLLGKSMDMETGCLGRIRACVVMFLTLLLFWLLLNWTVALDSLIVGVVVSLAITVLFRRSLSFFTELHFTPRAIITGFLYYGFFFKELIKSNLNLARIVLSPSLPINPAIVKVRTRLKSRMGRLMLANSITLTPGTLTVEVDGEWLYVHCVQANYVEVEQATAAIITGFERYLEVMYG